MRTRALGSAVVAMLMAGCMGGHCGPTSSASWTQAGLFDAIRSLEGADVSVVVQSPEAGLPFVLDSAPWPSYALLRLDDRNRSERYGESWRLDRVDDGRYRVSASLDAERADAWVRDAFASFVARWSLAGAEDRSAWADSFFASKEPGMRIYDNVASQETIISYHYWTTIQGPFDLENYYEDLAGNISMEEENWGVDEVRRSFGSVAFQFSVPFAAFTIEGDGGEYEVSGGANGYVIVRYPSELYVTEEEGQVWAQTTFKELGLPPPSFEDWDFWTMVC